MSSSLSAQPTPSLTVSVKLNGARLVGLRELAARYAANGPLPTETSELKQAFERSIVDLKRGSPADLSIYLVTNGIEKEVTLESGVYVDSTLGQIEFINGRVLAKPITPTTDGLAITGPIVLSVYYFSDDAKKIFGFDQFYFRLID